jgi:hypothetical protein
MTDNNIVTHEQFEILYNELEKKDFNIIEIAQNRKSMFSRTCNRTGKVLKRIKSYIQEPEVKSVVLVANWALSAALLLLMMITTSSVAVFIAVLSLFVIETYAVFGVIEYAIAYSMAQKLVKDSL